MFEIKNLFKEGIIFLNWDIEFIVSVHSQAEIDELNWRSPRYNSSKFIYFMMNDTDWPKTSEPQNYIDILAFTYISVSSKNMMDA